MYIYIYIYVYIYICIYICGYAKFPQLGKQSRHICFNNRLRLLRWKEALVRDMLGNEQSKVPVQSVLQYSHVPCSTVEKRSPTGSNSISFVAIGSNSIVKSSRDPV